MRDLEPRHSNSVKVVETRDVWKDAQAKRRADPGGTVASYVSEKFRDDECTHVRLNGEYVPRDRWDARRVASGSVVEVYRVEKVPAFYYVYAGVVALGEALQFRQRVLRPVGDFLAPPIADLSDQGRTSQSGTYSGQLITTTLGSGVPRGRIIGKMLGGGHLIQEFTGSTAGEVSRGSFKVAAYAFKSVATVDYGLGPYKSIAGYTADVDDLHLPENAPTNGTLLDTDGLFINGQPVQEYAGAGQVGIRRGTNFQAPPMSSLKTSREQQIGTEIEPSETSGTQFPVTATTIENVTGVGINFFFPRGFWHVRTAGKNAGTRDVVDFYNRIRIRPVGATAWVIDETVAVHNFDRGVMFFKPNGISVRIDFQKQNPKHAGLWGAKVEVEVRWGVNDGYRNGFYANVNGIAQLLSISEYTDVGAQSYPGRATVTFDLSIPDLSGQPNRFQALIEGAEMNLIDPDNPESEQLFGWSDSGADIVQDIITHEAYLGDVYGQENIHLPSFAEAKKWGLDMVPDGEGGTIRRWALNGNIDQFQSEDQLLRGLCAAMGASYWFDGYQFRIVLDREEDVTQVFSLFGMGAIRKGSLDRFDVFEQIFTAVDIRFRDEAMDYQYNTATWEDPDEQGNRLTRMQVEVKYVTSYARAYHMAERIGLRMKYENEGFTFEVGFPAVNSTPGNIIGLHHQLPKWKGISGVMRRDAPGPVGMYLDQDLTIDAGEPLQVFVKTVGTGSEVPQIRDVVSAPGFYPANTLINVNPSWDGSSVGDDWPPADTQYMIGPNLNENNMRGPARLYRVQEITRSSDTWAKFRVTKYDKRAYPVHHQQLKVTRPPPSTQPEDIPPNVTDLTVKFAANPTQRSSRSGTTGVLVSWKKAQWRYSYRCAVYARFDDISPIFNLLPDEVEDDSFFYDNLLPGMRITVAVTPISNTGRNMRAAQVCSQSSFTVPIVGRFVPEIVP